MKLLITLVFVSLVSVSLIGNIAAEDIAIINGKVHTMHGNQVIDQGTILVSAGSILQVGKNLKVPAGYTTIDAKGRLVTPGLMNALSRLSLHENTLSGSPEDEYAQNAAFSIAVDVAYGINPKSTLIPITRIEGITRAAVSPLPTKTIFGGQGSLIHLGDSTNIITKSKAFVIADLSEHGAHIAGGSRGASWVYLENAIAEVNGSNGGRGKPLLTALDIKALKPVTTGEIPLIIAVSRASDISNAIKFKQKHKLNIILLGVEEGWMLAKEIAAAKISVILDASHNLPTAFESIASTKANAARLDKAGVKIAFTTMLSDSEDHNARLVTQFVGQAVAYGLPWYKALLGLTVYPAQMFNIKNYGKIAAGMDADLVIWSGDPLEVMAAPEYLMIKGKAIALESRQTKLRDRYFDLNKKQPFGFRR